MKWSFSHLSCDSYGNIERPTFILCKANGDVLGTISNIIDPEIEIKYNEISTASFTIPRIESTTKQNLYDNIVVGREVKILPYGNFLIADIDEEIENGAQKKKVDLKSLEYELSQKKIVFGEGTYKLYSPTEDTETMLSMIGEKAINWNIAHVDTSLWGTYRTFDQTDEGLLGFLYGDIQESYGCVVVFDTEKRDIYIYDANNSAVMMPIYLSSDTVIKKNTRKTSDSGVANKISVYGADGVDIRDVNPTGSNEIINMGYALSTGELSDELAETYYSWKAAIMSHQDYYTGLVALRNSANSRLLAEQAALNDLNGELTTLENTYATYIQAKSVANNQETINEWDDKINQNLKEQTSKKNEIENKKTDIETIKAEYNTYVKDIESIVSKLRLETYFTEDELLILDKLFIEGEFTDSTFATFDVDISGENDSYSSLSEYVLTLKDVTVVDIAIKSVADDDSPASNYAEHRILDIAGGSFEITGDKPCKASLMHATLDSWSDRVVCSAFVGEGTIGESKLNSGNVSIVLESSIDVDSILGGMTKHENKITDEETGVEYTSYYYTGSIEIQNIAGKIYITRNATEYQTYSVQKELYDYASAEIEKLAYPVTEFEIDSANIVYAQKFEPFRNELELGKAVYLNMNDNLILKPVLLEVHLSFDDATDFKLVFSNEYQTKRPDMVNQMTQIIKDTVSANRTLDLSKYEFGKFNSSGAYSALANFLQNGMNAAYQQVTAGEGQTVTIDGGGIKIGSAGSNMCIMMANGMISIVDTEAREAKAAIGHFYNTSTNAEFNGVLADVIGGTLLAGKNLHMECFSPNGEVTQFKFDGTGAFLNNSRLYLQSDTGGRIGLDPQHGFLAGTSSLFEIEDTGIIRPSCKDENGDLVFDDDGFPKNTNVYIGIDGKAYFRGTVYATEGDFTGDITARNFYFDNGDDVLTLISKNKCDLSDLDYIDLGGITLDGRTGNINFTGAGSITWGANAPTKKQFAASSSGPWHDDMQSADKWRRDWDYATETWGTPYQFRGEDGTPGTDGSDADVTWKNIKNALQKAATTETTFITADELGAPNIYGGNIYGANIYAGVGSNSLAHMGERDFSIYMLDSSTPKIRLQVGEYGNDPQLQLGEGDGTGKNIFYIVKNESSANIIYYPSSGNTSGFILGDGYVKPLGVFDYDIPAKFG